MKELMPYLFNGGIILGMVGLIFKTNKTTQVRGDKTAKRMYGRIDEIKTYQEDNFTRKDMCQVLHNQVTQDLDEIKSDVKELLKRKQ